MMIKKKKKKKVFFDKQPKLPNILSKWETFVSNGNSHNIDLLFLLLLLVALYLFFYLFIKAYLRSSVVSLSLMARSKIRLAFKVGQWGRKEKILFLWYFLPWTIILSDISFPPFPTKKERKTLSKKDGQSKTEVYYSGHLLLFFFLFSICDFCDPSVAPLLLLLFFFFFFDFFRNKYQTSQL